MSDLTIPSRFDAGGIPKSRTGTPDPAADRQLKEMRTRDQQVRSHEQAHLAAAGGAATGGAKFSYEQGADGKRYATGGEVNIRSQASRNPQEALRNAAQVEKAALAPVDPSPQDIQVATQARQQQIQAQAQIAKANGPGGSRPNAYASGSPLPGSNLDIRG